MYTTLDMPFEQMPKPGVLKSAEDLVNEGRQRSQQAAQPASSIKFASTEFPPTTAPDLFQEKRLEEKANLEARAKAMNKTPGEILAEEEREELQAQIAADQRKIIDDDTTRVVNESIAALTRDEKIRSIDIAPVTQRVPDTLPPVAEEVPDLPTIPSPSSRVTQEGAIEIRAQGAIRTEQSLGGPPSSGGVRVGGSRDLPPHSLSRGPDGEPITNEEPKQNVG
jgi:hypothetical protein